MNIKRLLSAMLGLPLVVLVLALGNEYFIDIFFAIVAIISMYEYFYALKEKANPVKWIGYLSAISIAFIHRVVPTYYSCFIIYTKFSYKYEIQYKRHFIYIIWDMLYNIIYNVYSTNKWRRIK